MNSAIVALTLLAPTAPPSPAAPDVKETVRTGLKWLAEQQQEDGSWQGVTTFTPTTITAQNFAPQLHRYSLYAYDYWRVLDPLQLVAGVTYDSLEYPLNIDTSPITNAETSTTRVSPKAGIVWTPWKDTEFRGIYTRSLGGESLDSSVRLEPTDIAGFNQAFRSLIPESVEGLVPATRFETYRRPFKPIPQMKLRM